MLENVVTILLAQAIAAVSDEVLPAAARGRIRPVIDSVLPFDQATRAVDRMRGGRVHGKISLTVL